MIIRICLLFNMNLEFGPILRICLIHYSFVLLRGIFITKHVVMFFEDYLSINSIRPVLIEGQYIFSILQRSSSFSLFFYGNGSFLLVSLLDFLLNMVTISFLNVLGICSLAWNEFRERGNEGSSSLLSKCILAG